MNVRPPLAGHPQELRRFACAALAGLALLVGSCAKKATAPTVLPPAPPVPAIVASMPPPRSPSAFYDTPIWAQFDRALDAHTVNSRTVFLKLDTQRLACTITYDAGTRRVTIVPGIVLQLQRTYTVEFTEAITGVDGAPLPPNVFFQFTTNSLRRIPLAFPLPGSLESPVAALGWTASGVTSNIFYDVYASTDSAAVVNRSIAPADSTVFLAILLKAPLPAGAQVFWSVTSVNQTTHERLDAAVSSFSTYAAGAPVDTFYVPPLDWNYVDGNVAARPQHCSVPLVLCQTTRYNVPFAAFAGSSMGLAFDDWAPCGGMGYPGPPFADPYGALGNGAFRASDGAMTFASSRLAALVDAKHLGRGSFAGTLLRSTNPITYDLSQGGPALSRLVVTLYR